MEVTVTGKLMDPRERVLAIEAAAKAICDSADEDPVDAIMMLMTAAVHIATRHSDKPVKDVSESLAYTLGCAIVAADDFFTLKRVVNPN